MFLLSVHVRYSSYRDEHTYVLFSTATSEKAIEAQSMISTWIADYQEAEYPRDGVPAGEDELLRLRVGLMKTFPAIKESTLISMMDWMVHNVRVQRIEEWNG